MTEMPTVDWNWTNKATEQFQRDWKAGARPLIEGFLSGVAEPERGPLLDALLRIELRLRADAGGRPSAEEYRCRFRDHAAVVDAVFHVVATSPLALSQAQEAAQDRSKPGPMPAAGTIPPELTDHPDYEILRELGRGRTGMVFLARNRIVGRNEVLKVIGSNILELPGALDRFLREIRFVAMLQHPNIVTAYSAFRIGGSLVLAMEYVEGLDLARLVKARGPLPLAHACNFIYQAALGLQHAHQRGLVHRDIKPANLMLSHDGGRAVIKLLDFGLAKATREQSVLASRKTSADGAIEASPDLTLDGQIMGTPGFIAPEQMTDAQRADIRADIYSLGCTLYFLLSGGPPFHSSNVSDVLQAHHSMDARLLNLVRPEVPVELAAPGGQDDGEGAGKTGPGPGGGGHRTGSFFQENERGGQGDKSRSRPGNAGRIERRGGRCGVRTGNERGWFAFIRPWSREADEAGGSRTGVGVFGPDQ